MAQHLHNMERSISQFQDIFSGFQSSAIITYHFKREVSGSQHFSDRGPGMGSACAEMVLPQGVRLADLTMVFLFPPLSILFDGRCFTPFINGISHALSALYSHVCKTEDYGSFFTTPEPRKADTVLLPQTAQLSQREECCSQASSMLVCVWPKTHRSNF